MVKSTTSNSTKKDEMNLDDSVDRKIVREEEFNFRFTPAEFKSQLDLWAKSGWPVNFLLRDHYGAKVCYDNMVFPFIEFYGHEWKWDEEKGLSILFQEDQDSEPELRQWSEIASIVPVQKTPQGWLLFDGWNYTPKGLVPVHLWQWKELVPSYVFPESDLPRYCFVDIVSYCWEHEGMQGFGINTPHGHIALEFGDDAGRFYSVGQYMDPRSSINTKKSPAATVRAVLMSPDPYFPSRGEKTVHRYHLGTGPEGQANIAKLKRHIEQIQDWKKDPDTGIVKTCSSRKYHMLSSNCGDFCSDIEKFTQEQLGGQLIQIGEDDVYIASRSKVTSKEGFFEDLWTNLWNRFILFLVDMLLFFAISTPWLAKKIGANLQDDFDDPYFNDHPSTKPQGGMIRSLLRSFKPKPVRFPVRVRVEQLYSPRLRKYSAKLKS